MGDFVYAFELFLEAMRSEGEVVEFVQLPDGAYEIKLASCAEPVFITIG